MPILEGCGGFATHLPALRAPGNSSRAPSPPDTWITGSDDGTVSLWSTTKKRAVISWNHVHGFGGQGGRPPPHRRAKVFRQRRRRGMRDVPRAREALCGVSAETNKRAGGVSNAGRWVNAVATVTWGGSLRERERRRRDSAVAGERRAGAPARPAVVPSCERLRQRARRRLQRSLRARGDGTGTTEGGGPGTRTRKTACSCTGSSSRIEARRMTKKSVESIVASIRSRRACRLPAADGRTAASLTSVPVDADATFPLALIASSRSRLPTTTTGPS